MEDYIDPYTIRSTTIQSSILEELLVSHKAAYKHGRTTTILLNHSKQSMITIQSDPFLLIDGVG